MLTRRRGRWANIKTPLVQRLVFSGYMYAVPATRGDVPVLLYLQTMRQVNLSQHWAINTVLG